MQKRANFPGLEPHHCCFLFTHSSLKFKVAKYILQNSRFMMLIYIISLKWNIHNFQVSETQCVHVTLWEGIWVEKTESDKRKKRNADSVEHFRHDVSSGFTCVVVHLNFSNTESIMVHINLRIYYYTLVLQDY